jgi:hypothetical protein
MAGGAWLRHHCPAMSNPLTHRRKPELSGHQKQMRFLTGLGIGLCAVGFGAVLWLVNHSFKF